MNKVDLQNGVTITIPRELLPMAPPATVTPVNCESLFGLTPEQFRRLAKKGAFPVRREKGLLIAMYDDVRTYFARSVALSAPRVRKAPSSAASTTEKLLLTNGIRLRKHSNG